jgi:hypothetical protein
MSVKLGTPSTERIAVVGSREYLNLEHVRQFIWEQERTTVIVSGGALGVDTTATVTAQGYGMPTEVYLPDWNRYGRKAGAIRNAEIVAKADKVVAFWDGQSKGTKITIQMAKDAGKPVTVFGPDGQVQAAGFL